MIRYIIQVIFISLILIAAQHASAQKPGTLYQLNKTHCTYVEEAWYIINPRYVVYQHCDLRKIIYPDIQSFRVLGNPTNSKFALDKNGIYFEGSLVTPDTAGFELMTNYYEEAYHTLWKNNYAVFKDRSKLPGIDAATFTSLTTYSNPLYFKDKTSVYYLTKKIPMADAQSVSSKGGLIHDKNYIYQKDTILAYHGKPLHFVNGIFAKTDDEVISLRRMSPIKRIDVQTLAGFSANYSADRNHVYYDTCILKGAENDFDRIKTWEQINSVIFSDGSHLYSRDIPFADNIDAATFNMYPNSDLFYDKNGIYHKGWDDKLKLVTGVKIQFDYTVAPSSNNTFISDNYRYLVYNGQVRDFSENKIVTGLTEAEIKALKTMKAQYFPGALLQDILNKRVRLLGYGIIADGNKLFYMNQQVAGIDPHLLSYVGNDRYKYNNKILLFNSRNNTFLPLDRADAATFHAKGSLFYDKNYLYSGTGRLIKSKDVELLAAFAGPRTGGDEGKYFFNHYFYRNADGYWMQTTADPKVRFLGKHIDTSMVKLPKNFEWPRFKKSKHSKITTPPHHHP